MKPQFLPYIVLLLLTPAIALAQIPTEVPKPQDNKPIDLSNPADIIIYIVLPVLIIIFVLIYLNKRKKNKANE